MLAALLSLVLMTAELGPPVGEAIPETQRFEGAMGEDGATIAFVRSVDWCPYCKAQVIELGAQAAAFANEGRPLVIVSYDSPKVQAAFAGEHDLDVRFVADEGSKLITAFGLLNETYRPGSRAYGVPHPAVFVVDEAGVVEAKLYEEDYAQNEKSYRSRPAFETIIEAVRKAD
jgi:peroxiredoxin